jgi:hypothetical protein
VSASLLNPKGAIEGAVLDGFADVLGGDGVGSVEIGDRARDLEDTVVGAGAEVQFGHRNADELLRFVAEFAVLLDLARSHAGVAVHLGVGVEAELLFFASALDTIADRGGCFFGASARDIAVFDGGDFDVQIDAIEKRPGDALAVTLDLDGAATAFAFQIAEVSARIWIPIWARCV